jgi:hypothetical protein
VQGAHRYVRADDVRPRRQAGERRRDEVAALVVVGADGERRGRESERRAVFGLTPVIVPVDRMW